MAPALPLWYRALWRIRDTLYSICASAWRNRYAIEC